MAKIIINKTTLPDGTNGECGYLDADSETLIATEKVFAKGITYTLSFLVKADGGKTIRFCNGYNETELTHTTTTEWTKAIFTFTANDTFVGFIVPTGKYYLYQAQVESGELATNWNPSVNDSDKEIAELNSLILQTSEEIMTKVSANYATKDAFTGLESRVSKAETSITQTAEEIRLEASKTYSTKAELENSVQNLQDQIDGVLGSYSGSEVPTLDNYPANEWTTTAQKDAAIGSLYFVNSEGGDYAGFSYRWEKLSDGTYQWALLKDTEVTQALKELEDLKNNLANNYSTTVQMNSAIKTSADNITTSVSKTYSTKTETSKAQSTANTANSTANSALSKANTNATNISNLTTRVTNAESSITQNAEAIELKVSKGDVSSQLSVESDQVTISGNRLVVDADNFKLDKDGKLKATEAEISGSITSNDATITGGSVNVVGNDENDSKIIVRNSTDTLNSKIAPSFISMHFGYDHDVYLSAGLQDSFGSSGLRIFDNSTRLAVGVSKSGLNFGYANSSAIDAQYTRTNMLVNGNANANGEFRSTSANGLRIVQGDYGFFIRNDGGSTYFMLTDSGNQYGNWNDLRPLSIENATGLVWMNNGARISSLGVTGECALQHVTSPDGVWAQGGLAVGITGNTIKCIVSGSLVGTPSNTNSLKIFTDATLRSYYSGYHPHNTIILVANGDGNVFSGHIYSATYLASTAAWYAVMNINTSSIMRINYTIIMW